MQHLPESAQVAGAAQGSRTRSSTIASIVSNRRRCEPGRGRQGGWEKLVNRTGMTWRALPPARKTPGSDPEWLLLIKEYPALVRRPVVMLADGSLSQGFADKLFLKLFSP